jgi:hypothetical protein
LKAIFDVKFLKISNEKLRSVVSRELAIVVGCLYVDSEHIQMLVPVRARGKLSPGRKRSLSDHARK